jgi:hypothetical protein
MFENAIEAQLVNYFENIFNPFLAAFRSGFGCQSTLYNYKVGLKMTLIDHMHLISITASHEGGSQRPLISP